MFTHTPTITGLPRIFVEIVSEAAMQLPPLTRAQDVDFLRDMTGVVIEAFWQNYVAELPAHAYGELQDAYNDGMGEKALEWLKTYANFEIDDQAITRAHKVIQELKTALPRIMKAEYPQYGLVN